MTARIELDRALSALYLEVAPAVAAGVTAKVEAAIAEAVAMVPRSANQELLAQHAADTKELASLYVAATKLSLAADAVTRAYADTIESVFPELGLLRKANEAFKQIKL